MSSISQFVSIKKYSRALVILALDSHAAMQKCYMETQTEGSVLIIKATLLDRFLVRTAFRFAVEAVHNRMSVAGIYHTVGSPAMRTLLMSHMFRLRNVLFYVL